MLIILISTILAFIGVVMAPMSAFASAVSISERDWVGAIIWGLLSSAIFAGLALIILGIYVLT